MRTCFVGIIGAVACLVGAVALADEAEVFRQANEQARQGDYPKAIAGWESLARQGHATASLYWNWARAAEARGELGEALWAQLQARELDPGDAAVRREIDRLRAALNLDPAEIAPEPLAAVRRLSRRVRLAWGAIALLALSVLAHLAWRYGGASRRLCSVAWTSTILGAVLSLVVAAGGLARPVGVVARRGAPLLDGAASTAQTVGSLREGEVVPILERSGGYVRVEDSSGARGWAHEADVRRVG